MRIAFYIEDGREQLVLTPETDYEKSMLGKLHDGTRELKIMRGSFYNCMGGWIRHRQEETDDSTMILLTKKES